jgi:hypothetical protein
VVDSSFDANGLRNGREKIKKLICAIGFKETNISLKVTLSDNTPKGAGSFSQAKPEFAIF